MSLESSIADNAEMMRAKARELDGWLSELKTLLPDSERARQVFINVRQTLGCIHSEITQIQTTLAAARMCGAMTSALKPPSQPELALPVELRAASRAHCARREHEAMIESLHRAGDHSLDEETEGRAV